MFSRTFENEVAGLITQKMYFWKIKKKKIEFKDKVRCSSND